MPPTTFYRTVTNKKRIALEDVYDELDDEYPVSSEPEDEEEEEVEAGSGSENVENGDDVEVDVEKENEVPEQAPTPAKAPEKAPVKGKKKAAGPPVVASTSKAKVEGPPKPKYTKKVTESTDLVKTVLESVLMQDDHTPDELDKALESIAMRMRKHLDDDEREDCLAEINQVITRHVKSARAARRFGQARDDYFNNMGPQGPGAVRVDDNGLQYQHL